MKKILLVFILFFTFTFANADFYSDYESYPKVIKVNTYYEKLSYYEFWEKVGEFDVSTWDYENQTPTGKFKVMTKNDRMFSKSAWKWMPYWMEFFDWTYGIHWIPETYNWTKTSSEENMIWKSAAGGCVRVWEENIKKLYDWADYDTVVLISYDKDEYAPKPILWETVLNNYFNYLEQDKYLDAYVLEENHKYSFSRFRKIFNIIEFKLNSIKKVNTSYYNANVDVYFRWTKLLSDKNLVFLVKNWKIYKTYF